MADERWKECKHHHDGCACREHAWAEQVERLKFELDVEKSNYEFLKGEWNRAVALAQEHCPKPVLGQAWLTDGIPLLAERAKRAEDEVEWLNESLAQAKGEIERMMSVSRYEERESSDAKAEVELLKDVLRIKGYRESCSIPGCNCGEHGWIHGGYADDRLREIHDALDDDCHGKTLLDAVIALKSHTWEQERVAIAEWMEHEIPAGADVFDLFERIKRGDHWPKG